MPIGIIVNIICVVLGGITGSLIGHKLSDSFKDGLNTVFGVCAMSIGISSIILMANMPAVIFSVIAGTAIGLAIQAIRIFLRTGFRSIRQCKLTIWLIFIISIETNSSTASRMLQVAFLRRMFDFKQSVAGY